MGFHDRFAEKAARKSYERRVEKMSGPRGIDKYAKKGAPAPYVCGAKCAWNGPGTTCQSTVRGGICPCRCC